MRRIFLTMVLSVSTVAAAEVPLENWAEILITQARNRQPLPALSAYGAELNFAQAYALQRQFVGARLREDGIGGFKAGMTDRPTQLRFGIREPVAGVLLKSGDLMERRDVRLEDYGKLMIEIELGYVMNTVIERPVADVKTLKALIREVFPVVELLDLGYEDPDQLRATDIIASNVSAASYIVGRALPTLDEKTVNAVFVELFRDGEVIDRGKAINVMGDQYEALLWLVNKTIAQGWVIKPEHLLITGSLGDMMPAPAGAYMARYRDIQDIRFRVRPRPAP